MASPKKKGILTGLAVTAVTFNPVLGAAAGGAVGASAAAKKRHHELLEAQERQHRENLETTRNINAPSANETFDETVEMDSYSHLEYENKTVRRQRTPAQRPSNDGDVINSFIGFVVILSIIIGGIWFLFGNSETEATATKSNASYSSISAGNADVHVTNSKKSNASTLVSYRHVLNLLKGCAVSRARNYYNANIDKFSKKQKDAINSKFISCNNKKIVVIKEKTIEKKVVSSDYQRIATQISKKQFMTASSILKYSNGITAGQKKELEKLALAKVKPIPASDYKSNLWGYQLLDALNPADHYKAKIKHYGRVNKNEQEKVASVKRAQIKSAAKKNNAGNGNWIVIVNGKKYVFTKQDWGNNFDCFDYADMIAKMSRIKKTDYVACTSPYGRKVHYDSDTLLLMKYS